MSGSSQSDEARGARSSDASAMDGEMSHSHSNNDNNITNSSRNLENRHLLLHQQQRAPPDQRFTSPQSLPSGSWESSLDDDNAAIRRTLSSPSRPPSSGERRKFDTTTPTLIDEDECDTEMLFAHQQSSSASSPTHKQQQQQLQHHQLVNEESMRRRRTPGATMYRSVFDSELEEATASMRLVDTSTEAASSASSERQSLSRGSADSAAASTTSRYHHQHQQQQHRQHKTSSPDRRRRETQQQQQGIWDSFSTQSGTPSPTHQHRSRDQIQPSRPPLAPPTSAAGATSSTPTAHLAGSHNNSGQTTSSSTNTSSTTSTTTNTTHTTNNTGRAGEAPGIFSSSAWSGTSGGTGRSTSAQDGTNNNNANNTNHNDNSSNSNNSNSAAAAATTTASGGNSSNINNRPHGAFSPNLLRLTENIGNILHEDEDDAYAADIPTLRGAGSISGEELSQFGNSGSGDWTGSYVFNRGSEGFGHQQQQRRVQRSSIVSRSGFKEGKSRRHPGQDQRRQGNLQHAPKPQARRSGNELPQFGPFQGETNASPQLFNFGGAFEPPRDQHSSFSPIQHGHRSPFPPPQDRPRSTEFGAVRPFEGQASPSPSQGGSFYNPSPTAARPFGEYLAPEHFHLNPSEMHATAREFVPMGAAMTPPPQFSSGLGWPAQAIVQPQHLRPQQQQTQPPSPFEQTPPPPMAEQAWPSYNYDSGPTYRLPSPTVDTRASLTPSPGVSSWYNQTQSILRVPEPDRPSSAATHQSQPLPPSVEIDMQQQVPQPPGTPTSPDQAAREAKQNRKDTKRGKRGQKKKKTFKKKDVTSSRPGSSLQESEEGAVSGSDTNVDPKRAELEETPAARTAFKDFFKAFKNAEKHSFQNAEDFAWNALDSGSLPESAHWRVYLELADLAKRSNRYVEARALYQRVCELQPYANQGWLEYSKLEEECGHMNRVTNILHSGLEHCEYNENLLTRAVKHQEKMGNLDSARGLLARLKHVGIEKVWKTVLEGALLEARAGNSSMARRVLKYLMHHVPWYGPLYLEAYKLERDLGHPMDALQIVEQGLQAIPRYGPLWFGAFRLCEDLDMSQRYYALPQTMGIIARATMNISKELVWKVHLEAAQMLERSALEQAKFGTNVNEALEPARHRFALTVLTCPNNLRWKVWLATARMELSVGNSDTARILFARAHTVVPDKSRSASLLDCARLEEFVGDTELARAVLCKGRVEYVNDWKVWLESVLLEMRNNQTGRAIEIASDALVLHKGTGRLWATLVQLSQTKGGDQAQRKALCQALNAVPKSGEVWCEGARIHLNPFSDTFGLLRARRHLHFATKFTPQYGDSFIESLRLESLKQWLEPVAEFIWEETRGSLEPCLPNEHDRLTKYLTDILLLVSIAWNGQGSFVVNQEIMYDELLPQIGTRLQALQASIDLSDLRLACSNADPNYGSVWFSCRRVPTDTPRRVIEDAAGDVVAHVRRHVHLYIAAMVRRFAVLSSCARDAPPVPENPLEISDPAMEAWEQRVDEALLSGPTLQRILNPTDPTTGLRIFQSVVDGSDFVTAHSALSRAKLVEEMPLSDRRKCLFGTDALFT